MCLADPTTTTTTAHTTYKLRQGGSKAIKKTFAHKCRSCTYSSRFKASRYQSKTHYFQGKCCMKCGLICCVHWLANWILFAIKDICHIVLCVRISTTSSPVLNTHATWMNLWICTLTATGFQGPPRNNPKRVRCMFRWRALVWQLCRVMNQIKSLK